MPSHKLCPIAGNRALGSFLKQGEKEYRVRMKVRVEKLEDSITPSAGADRDEEEEGGGVDLEDGPGRKPHVAVDVVTALCECPAGGSGGCHHAAMVLLLCRLLHMSEGELAAFNPLTVTGQACSWIMKNCKGGRSTSKCPYYGMSLAQASAAVRELRDPRGQIGVEDDAPLGTRGVTPIDRRHHFNPHPIGEKWSVQKEHFDNGVSISSAREEKLKAFVNGEKANDHQEVALDFLPPFVREDT